MLAYLNSSAKLVDDGILPCHEIALLDMMAGIGHEAQIKERLWMLAICIASSSWALKRWWR